MIPRFKVGIVYVQFNGLLMITSLDGDVFPDNSAKSETGATSKEAAISFKKDAAVAPRVR